MWGICWLFILSQLSGTTDVLLTYQSTGWCTFWPRSWRYLRWRGRVDPTVQSPFWSNHASSINDESWGVPDIGIKTGVFISSIIFISFLYDFGIIATDFLLARQSETVILHTMCDNNGCDLQNYSICQSKNRITSSLQVELLCSHLK